MSDPAQDMSDPAWPECSMSDPALRMTSFTHLSDTTFAHVNQMRATHFLMHQNYDNQFFFKKPKLVQVAAKLLGECLPEMISIIS